MKRKVAEIFIDDDEESTELSFEYFDDFSIAEKLGILEWAKAVVLKTVEIDNALAEYNEDEA